MSQADQDLQRAIRRICDLPTSDRYEPITRDQAERLAGAHDRATVNVVCGRTNGANDPAAIAITYLKPGSEKLADLAAEIEEERKRLATAADKDEAWFTACTEFHPPP